MWMLLPEDTLPLSESPLFGVQRLRFDACIARFDVLHIEHASGARFGSAVFFISEYHLQFRDAVHPPLHDLMPLFRQVVARVCGNRRRTLDVGHREF